jgi:hypothetical protein
VLDVAMNVSDGDSRQAVKSKVSDALNCKFSIVKRVIEVKLAEAENNEKRVTEAAHRQRILDIIADKKDEGLKSKSVEELESMLLDSK